MKIGYARVSTDDQRMDLQRDGWYSMYSLRWLSLNGA